MTPVRLEPAASRSRVKHSTTEPLRSYISLIKNVQIHTCNWLVCVNPVISRRSSTTLGWTLCWMYLQTEKQSNNAIVHGLH